MVDVSTGRRVGLPLKVNGLIMDAAFAGDGLQVAAAVSGAASPQERADQPGQQPGQLVLFPSWILHDVKPFEGEGERITVAFNCWFSLKDDTPTRA